MKKSNIRSLFIVLLALILVFALVACNNKGGDKDKDKDKDKDDVQVENVQEFFNTLWDQSKGIGNVTVGAKDDVKLNVGLTLTLATETADGEVKQSIDVGVDLEAVLDRSSHNDNVAAEEQSSKNTAIKARLYDPTSGENWLTLYYFLNDVDNLYVDFAGQNLKVPFEYFNNTYNGSLDKLMFRKELLKGKTLNEILTTVTQNMGANWNLNTLVNDVVKLLGINLKEMVEGSELISGMLGGMLEDEGGIDALFDANGSLNVNKILASKAIANALFINDNTIVNQNGYYRTGVKWAFVSGILSGDFANVLKQIITDDADVYLQFQTKDSKLDSFGLKAVLNGHETRLPNGEDGVEVVPAVTLNITSLGIKKADASNAVKLAKDKAQYTTDKVLNASATLNLKGVKVDATKLDRINHDRFSSVAALNGNTLQLTGKVSVDVSGRIDLADNDKLAAKAVLSYQAEGATKAVNVLEASFVGGKLAVKVNQQASLVALDSKGNKVDVPIAATLVNLWGDNAYNALAKAFKGMPLALARLEKVLFADDTHRSINPNFEGVVWENIDIATGFKGLIDNIVAGVTKTAKAAGRDNTPRIIETVLDAFQFLSTDGNKLTLATLTDPVVTGYENIGNAITTIRKIWFGNKTFAEYVFDKDTDNWLGAFANAIIIDGAKYTSIPEGKVVTDDEFNAAKAKEPNKGLVTDQELAAAKKLDANQGKADDVLRAELQAAKDKALRTKLQKANDKARSEAFLNEILAATAKVTLDMTESTGLNLNVELNVNEKTGLTIDANLGAKETETFEDLAKEWKEDANHFVFTISHAPVSGSIDKNGILTVTCAEADKAMATDKAYVDVKIGTNGTYVRVEGTWKDGTFTSSKPLDGIKAKVIVKARFMLDGTDGASFGVKVDNNYVAPATAK